ncbi:MAG TPA: hypothetical protein VFT84_11730 [Gemmatimonadales bacterium]|nr:hypothetical protein [Gemmatimonadales bacterium]
MLEPHDGTGRVRTVIRYGVVVLAGIVAGSRAVSAYAALRQGRSLTLAQVDIAIAVVCLGVAGLGWWLLRPRAR